MTKRRKLRLYRGAKRGESEASLERWCCGKAQERGWRSRKMNGLGFRDWPDRLLIRPPRLLGKRRGLVLVYRRPVWVELKKRGKQATPKQKLMHQFLRTCGEDVRVISTKEDFVALLDE